MREINIGVIGTGMIAGEFVRTVKLFKGVTCCALYSRQMENGRRFADTWKIDKVYDQLEEMLKDKTVDTVYIAVPNSLHYTYALKAIEYGKNVICEKPFTSTLKETERLITMAEKEKRFLFEAITTIYSPNYLLLKEKIRELGKIKLVQCTYSQFSGRYKALLEGKLPNIFNPIYSGGALMDLNIYNLHLVIGLFGLPGSVDYFPNLHENGIDTSGVVILGYGDMLCECLAAKDVNGISSVQIQGENGYIYIPEGSNNRKSFSLITADSRKEFDEEKSDDRLIHELSAFVSMIRDADWKQCMEKLEHTRQVMSVIQKARESAGLQFEADNRE